MAKADVTEQSNQLNLTVVALVALVAIVGLVALVLYTANAASGGFSTGSQIVSAEDDNFAGAATDGACKECLAKNNNDFEACAKQCGGGRGMVR